MTGVKKKPSRWGGGRTQARGHPPKEMKMNGLGRYKELMAAAKVVQVARLALAQEEGSSPAWEKLIRVGVYLNAQGAHVMEGRTEDGEESDEKALRTLARALQVEELENIFGGDVRCVVDMMMSTKGYSQDVAEDVEERAVGGAR